MVQPVGNNQNSHYGLMVGTGAAALEAAAALNKNKTADDLAEYANGLKETVTAVQDRFIKDLKAKNLSTEEMAKQTKKAEKLVTYAEKFAKYGSNYAETLRSSNKSKLIAISTPLFIAAGAVVDYMNNRQKAKSKPNAETKNGNEYVKVNMGKKLGVFLGLACEGGIVALNKAFKNPYKTDILVTALTAAGGFLLGAITDSLHNKKAAKEADKKA